MCKRFFARRNVLCWAPSGVRSFCTRFEAAAGEGSEKGNKFILFLHVPSTQEEKEEESETFFVCFYLFSWEGREEFLFRSTPLVVFLSELRNVYDVKSNIADCGCGLNINFYDVLIASSLGAIFSTDCLTPQFNQIWLECRRNICPKGHLLH